MVSSCSAVNCKRRVRRGEKVKFHRFPKNEEQRKKWIIAVGRKDFNPSNTAVICGAHFLESDYETNVHGNLVLKRESVPSIFNFKEHLILKQKTQKICHRENVFSDLTDTSLKRMITGSQVLQVEANSLLSAESDVIASLSSNEMLVKSTQNMNEKFLKCDIVKKENEEMLEKSIDEPHNKIFNVQTINHLDIDNEDLQIKIEDIKMECPDFPEQFVDQNEMIIQKCSEIKNEVMSDTETIEWCETKSPTHNVTDIQHDIDFTHSKLNMHQCHSCGYSKNIESFLETHISTLNSDSKRFHCDACNYATNRKADLWIHIDSVHFDLKKFKCDNCDCGTVENENLRSNVNSVHLKLMKHKCDIICDYVTSRAAERNYRPLCNCPKKSRGRGGRKGFLFKTK